MASTCFPDTTVLINFGYINRFDILEALLTNPTWCLTVSRECRKSYNKRGFTTYPTVKALFGDALIPGGAELINAQKMRDDMAKPTDKPDAHMGEAETIAIIQSRPLGNPIFVTDDVKATAFAKQEGLTTLNTWALLKVAVRVPRITFTETDAWKAALTLRRNRRGWPKGVGQSHAEFMVWLKQP